MLPQGTRAWEEYVPTDSGVVGGQESIVAVLS